MFAKSHIPQSLPLKSGFAKYATKSADNNTHDITKDVPSLKDLESFEKTIKQDSEKQESEQPFTEAEDTELEKRFQNLESPNDISSNIPSKEGLDSFEKTLRENSETHQTEQPFTDFEDLNLEKRLKDLESAKDISSGIPNKEELEPLENFVRENSEVHQTEQPFTEPGDLYLQEKLKNLEPAQNICSNKPEKDINESAVIEDIVNQLPSGCVNSGGLDSSAFNDNIIYDLYNLVINCAEDLLINNVGSLSLAQSKFFTAVFLGAIITKYFRGTKVSEDQSNNESSRDHNAANRIVSGSGTGTGQLSQDYIDSVKDITVNMNRIDLINHPQLRSARVDGYYFANRTCSASKYEQPIALHGRTATPAEARNCVNGQNYGVFGGTKDVHEDILALANNPNAIAQTVIANKDTGKDIATGVPMLNAFSNQ